LPFAAWNWNTFEVQKEWQLSYWERGILLEVCHGIEPKRDGTISGTGQEYIAKQEERVNKKLASKLRRINANRERVIVTEVVTGQDRREKGLDR
jgi:hypothetical protein